MNILKKLLEEIYALLDQMDGITLNQATILLQPRKSNEDNNEAIDLLNQMVEYKDELIASVARKEEEFERAYEPYRGKIKSKSEIEDIKILVDRIMNKKQEIVEKEKNNMLIMKNLGNTKKKAMHISPTADKVVNAYKVTSKEISK